MAKKRRPKSKGTKLSLGAFLRLDTPAPTSALAPPSVRLPAAQIKRKPPSDPIALAADYKRDNPTPLEVYARQAFQGLCIECQMTFATWKLNGFADSLDERKYAHHSFRDLGNCWCPLCRMLSRDFIERNGEEALQELRSPENQLVNIHIDIYKWSLTSQNYIFDMRFENLSEHKTIASFEMYSAGRDSRSTRLTMNSSTDCKPVWDMATKWLQECRELHPDCATTHAIKTLPTRLLNIGTSNDDLRLILSKLLPVHTQYATLSHCWGLKPFMKLTQKNFDAFLDTIPFEHLSKTFRDAITAARNLGFRYLWIDSLCIIQEDKEDWQHEARMMTDVYSNSSLNFAAADSPDGETGCFFDDRPEPPLTWQITFPHNGPAPSATIPDRHTWNCIAFETRKVKVASRLSSRAWTLQERLLPPRTLYFGRDQIAWECRQGNGYETLPDKFSEGIFAMSPRNFFALLTEVNPLLDTDNFQIWSSIVQDYTGRELTVSRDKLVAISGVARILAPVYGTDYVAGLWVKDLLWLLVWYKYSGSSAARDVTMIYRAPSWSWASVDGSVSYPMELFISLEDESATRSEDPERPPLAKVLEAVTTYPEDQYGEVTSGFIHLRVQALYRVTIDTQKWVFNQPFLVHILGLGNIEQFVAYPDYDLGSIEGESVLMPLAVRKRSNLSQFTGGLLLELVEAGVYRRKGAWTRVGDEDYNKLTQIWPAKGADRIANRAAGGLDEGEFASLWDGEAYVLKII